MFEGTLLEMARSRVCCAFGLDGDIFCNDLGAVPYRKRMKISPNSGVECLMTVNYLSYCSRVCRVQLE